MTSQFDDDAADRLEGVLTRLRVPAFMASYSAALLAGLRTPPRLAKHLRAVAVRVPGDRAEVLLVGSDVRRPDARRPEAGGPEDGRPEGRGPEVRRRPRPRQGPPPERRE